LALVRILRRYRLSVVPGTDIGVHVESTMLVPTNGLPMQIHTADGNFVSSPIVGNIHQLVDFDTPLAQTAVEPNGTGNKRAVVPQRPK